MNTRLDLKTHLFSSSYFADSLPDVRLVGQSRIIPNPLSFDFQNEVVDNTHNNIAKSARREQTIHGIEDGYLEILQCAAQVPQSVQSDEYS